MCEFKDYWFPNYDVGAKYLIYPFFKAVERDCKADQKKETYLFYDQNYNPDPIGNNFQVFAQNFTSVKEDEYSLSHSSWFKMQNYVFRHTKFYKKKEDFKADYWVDYTDRDGIPKFEVDI